MRLCSLVLEAYPFYWHQVTEVLVGPAPPLAARNSYPHFRPVAHTSLLLARLQTYQNAVLSSLREVSPIFSRGHHTRTRLFLPMLMVWEVYTPAYTTRVGEPFRMWPLKANGETH